jgi:cytochrome c oxidase subunit 2
MNPSPPVALDPKGPFAQPLSDLSWMLFWVVGGVLAIVVIATAAALVSRGRFKSTLGHRWTVVAGGFAFPVVVLTLLLGYGLAVTAKVSAAPAASDLRIRVIGEMWWWRIQYLDGDRVLFETANEIHIPVGRDVTFELRSNDVIHAFWVPQLGAKRDMIPGRINLLRLAASESGVYRGQCSEYCGGAHALMAMEVVAEPAAEFEAWAAAQAMPAAAPMPDLFASSGCGACHTVRGTNANGRIGPDLTHIAGRRMIAAGILRNDAETLRRFIRHSGNLKPGLRMPDYDRLTEAEVDVVASWLESLT